MAFNSKANYCKGVVICHGKSEWCMTRFISTNLHLPIKAHARDNGKCSIQVTGLMKLLNSKPFHKQSTFVSEFSVEETGRGKNKHLVNFKLFIIMDTDDCTVQQRQDYLSKKMFEEHWLYDYIVPIENFPCLEDVLVETGMMPKKIRDSEKGTYYSNVFPINKKPLSNDTLAEVLSLKSYLRKSDRTNLIEYIDYCLSLLPH